MHSYGAHNELEGLSTQSKLLAGMVRFDTLSNT